MQDISAQKTGEIDDRNSGKKGSSNKKILIIIGVALLLLITVWIGKNMEINKVEKTAESKYQALKEQSIKNIVAAKEEHLTLLAKSYVWSVRTEMMKDNPDQLNLYANDMIKEKNFILIAISNDSGIVISSTDKKYEGKAFTSIGEAAALNDNNTLVKNAGDSILTVTSPIMGFNTRLGTLLIKYAVQLPVIGNKE